ncbi:aliphatic sulfonate ABC transporter substrate-binding protein [Nocardia blacklockiae]|uniref:aliphatic sulfonate ABC transporter substrate-binding protein n=1 Tax=Nocardia blacklockiae TaxID=480036 RepID=UPI0018960190|nr:aliphatic sulfonate ABC transporter substrate-binding protein [Nocardia blacklockiae]MBF6175827.1 aliphatic sulfonate ABC transporter substrate-binding protein [Nocardia blacklockiae]
MRFPTALTAVVAVLAATVSGCVAGEGSGGSGAREIRLDYAYYNPLSLVVREQRLLENQGIATTWVQSAGSNKANENLRARAIDLGSTAGSAALLARANGTPIKSVYVYSKPEWSALAVPANSPITEPNQLRGKKIAATKGTDPYFFLLQTLATAGLSGKDVEVVNLQHADGKTALERGTVDAWAGLDPYLAQARQESGARLAYRNPDFSTYGVLNAREDFATAHPDLVQAVIDAYAQAKAWAAQHPDELTALLAREAKIAPAVAAEELERTQLTVDPVPGPAQRAVLDRVVPIIVADGSVRSDDDARTALDSLIEPEFAARQGNR